MNNINFNGFDVIVIEQQGELSVTTCYKKYADYVKDKGVEDSHDSIPTPSLIDTTQKFYGGKL